MAQDIVYLLVRVCIPPIPKHISLEEYGIWTCVLVMNSYVGLGEHGIFNTYIKYVAQYHANRQTEKINKLLSTGIVITALISVVISLFLGVFCPSPSNCLIFPIHLPHSIIVFSGQ